MQQNEAIVAKVNDLQNGEMRQVSVGDLDLLLIRKDETYFATGAYCTHYQAPLEKGVLSGDRVVCPWHNACFNITTGAQVEPPGLDSLPHYAVRIEGDNVIVHIPDAASSKTPVMAKHDSGTDSRTFVVLGAGAAGAHAVETLRTAGFQGRLILATQEDCIPYDRTWLSKDYFTGKKDKSQVPLRSPQFYRDRDIELYLNKTAVEVNAAAKTVQFQDGETLDYDALLLATGGKPQQLRVPGAEIANVFTFRSLGDCERLLAAAKKASQAVVVGSSFIGMEAAAGLTQHGVKVTVVSPDAVPFQKTLGTKIGSLFQQVHEENGVSFQLDRKVIEIKGNEQVEAVILDDGQQIPADLVVVGIGVQPATDFVKGIDLHSPDKSVQVDSHLCAADGLYAAGDIARYRDRHTDEWMRVEHWRVAAQQGRIAALNMAGQPMEFAAIPVFWTMQFKFPLRYVGHADDWDEIIVDGSLQERKFIALYVKNDRVVAAATSQRDTETAAITELMRLDRMPTPDTLRQGNLDFVDLLAKS